MYTAKIINAYKEHSIVDNYDYIAVQFNILNEDKILFELNHAFDLATSAEEIQTAVSLVAEREYEKAKTAVLNAEYEARQKNANDTIKELLTNQ